LIEQDINERMAGIAPSQNVGEDPAILAIKRNRGMLLPTENQAPMSDVAQPTVELPQEPDYAARAILEDRRNRMMSSVYTASKVDPERAAKAQKLSAETGIGSGIALRHLDEMMVDARMREIERKNYFAENHVLANSLSDPEFAAVAQDDLGTLDRIGGFFGELAMFSRYGFSPSTLKGTARGMAMVERGQIGAAAAAALATPQDIDRAEQLRQDMTKLQGGGLLAATAEVVTQQIANLKQTATMAAGGAAVGSAVPGVGTVAGGALGFAAGTITSTAQMEGGNAYLDMRADGVPDDVAIPAAIAIGFLNGAIEVYGLKLAASPFKGLAKKAMAEATAEALAKPSVRSALAIAGKEYVKQVGGEGVEEALQQTVSVIGDRIAKAASGMEYEGSLKKDLGQIIESFGQGALASVLLGGIGPGANLVYDLNRAEAAVGTQQFLQNLTTAVKEGTLKPRSPMMLERYIQAQAERYGVGDFYIAGTVMRDVINASGITPEQLEQVLPGMGGQVRGALLNNGDVNLTPGQYAATIAGTKFGDALMPHIRVGDPRAVSYAQAQQINANREQMREDATKIIGEMERTDTAFVESARNVENAYRDQIERTGRPREEAEAAATFVRDFYVVLGASMGQTPEQVQQRFPYRFEGQAAAVAEPLEQAARQKYPSLAKAWDRYNSGEILMTIGDLADKIDSLDLAGKRIPQSVLDAVQEFRNAQREEREVYGERGGTEDDAGNALEIAVQNAAEQLREASPNIMEQAATMDAEYMAAVERGDMDAAQRMVDEAAKAAGYNVVAYHGTDAEPFTIFGDYDSYYWGKASYFSPNREYAEMYSYERTGKGFSRVMRVNLKLGRVFSPETNPEHLAMYRKWTREQRKSGRGGPFFVGGPMKGKYGPDKVKNVIDYEDQWWLVGRIWDAGFDAFTTSESDGQTIAWGLKNPNQVKLADPVTYDEAGNVVPLSRRFDITSPRIFEQAAVPAQAGADAPGIGVSNENRLGFWPALRVRIQPNAALPEKPLILTGTTNKNATKQLANLDDILGRFPNAAESPEAWAQMLAYAFGTDDVPVPPYAFINDTNGNGSFDRLSTLTQGQIADATHGFDNAREFRRAYINNELDVITTGKLFLWSFLSRGVSPYTQESLFIDAFDGANEWIKKAASGKFTEADFDDYTAWAKSVAKKGSGQPGAGATHNLNAFGKNFLFKMGAIGEDGKSNLQRLHDMMSDPEQTGRMIRREFAKFGEGVGIDNKVVSFTLLVAGFNDVMVLDRVQVRQLWDDGRFSGTNLYDGVMDAEGQKIAGSSLNALTEGVRGILVYEAIERQLAAKINDLYAKLGRPQDASIGRYHWETWVAYSQQEAAHATLDAILLDAKGDDQAISKVSGKQGEYGAYEYGAQYNRDTNKTPWFRYTTPLGGTYDFSVPAFRQFLAEIKKVGNGVVPAKFKVTESGNAPWYTRPEVNQQRLEEQAAKWSDRGGGTGEGTRLVRQAAANADAIRARSGTGVQPAGRGAGLEQAARGPARGFIDPKTLIATITQGGDLATLIHESAHAFLVIYGRIAQQPDAPAFIKADMDTVLRWGNVPGDTPEARLATWSNMTVDEQRTLHESFAYNFEIYAWEGKAPSAELRGVFQRFRAYLTRIYKSIRDDLNAIYRREFGTDLPILTPEVRAVMDRMLASERQIKQYQAINSMAPYFQTQEEAQMDDATWAAYVAMNQEAEDQAIADLTKASLGQVDWIRRARISAEREEERGMAARRREVKDEATQEVRGRLVYRLQDYLRTGRYRDEAGEEITVEGPHRLSVDRIEALYTGIPTAESVEAIRATGMAVPAVLQPEWRRLGFGKSGMLVKEGGVDPEMVAETFGYPGGDAMIRALVDAPKFSEAVEARTNELMQERYGEMDSPEAREQRISEAIHNEARARLVAVELRHVSRATEPVAVMLEAARIAAQDILARKRLRDIRPQDHEAAEARAARDAINARRAAGNPAAAAQAAYTRAKNAVLEAPREDTVEALLAATDAAEVAGEAARAESMARSAERIGRFVEEYGNVQPDLLVIRAKRAQLYQNQLAAEARKAKAYVEKQVKYLRKVLRDENRKRMGAGYADQIEALLANVNLVAMSAAQRQQLADLGEWLKKMEADGVKPDISEDLAKAAFRVPYKDLTLDQFRELVEAVRTIEYMGKNEQKVLLEKQKAEFKEKEAAIVKNAEAVARSRGRIEKLRRSGQTRAAKASAKLRGFFAAGLKAWAIVEVIDGGPGGPLWEYLIRTANDRADMETEMNAAATKRLTEILEPWYRVGNMMAGKVEFPSIGRSMTREARLAIALNYGNAGNIQRLLDGEGWTQEQVQPILESLTAEEWDAVQQVWDFMDEYRPLIAAKERKLFGKEPNWVEPQELTVRTVDGKVKTLLGGYYPIVYDPVAAFRSEKQSEVDTAEAQLKGAFTAATTRRTFTKERAAKVEDRPLLYSLQGLWSGVTDVIHDLSWHEWLIDANRLMRSEEFDRVVRARYGEQPKLELRRWIEDVAAGGRGALTPGMMAAAFMRQNVSVAGLGYSIRGALLQLTGFSMSVTRVGWGPLLRGISAFAVNPLQTMRRVNDMSKFMEMRSRTQFKELNEIRNRVEGQRGWERGIRSHAYTMMLSMQRLVDIPTWLAGYENAIADGKDEDTAIALADQGVIATQGSGLLKDLSRVEREKGLASLFTVFYSYFNTVFNLATVQTMTARSRGKAAHDLLMILVVPVMVEQLLKEVLTPDGEDKEEKDLGKVAAQLTRAEVEYLLGMFVYVRELQGVSGMIDGGMRGYEGPAGLRGIVTIQRAAQQAGQGEFDRGFRRSAVDLLGIGLGLPSAQINRTIDGLEALSEGETENPLSAVMGVQRR
jgi:hypothetical protein